MAAFAAAIAILLAATIPVNAYLIERFYESSKVGLAARAATDLAGSRPMVAVVGSSQTGTGVQALRIEQRLARDGDGPFVATLAAAGFHASAFPFVVRRLLAGGGTDTVLIELGHVAQDQYQGAWLVRSFIEDDGVRRAFLDCTRGRALAAQIDSERIAPWTYTPELIRSVIDDSFRDATPAVMRARMTTSRGFGAHTRTANRETLVALLNAEFLKETGGLIDASPQAVFVASASACAAICRERGVRFAVFIAPINQSVAARVPVMRHFRRESETVTVPALRAIGIEVLVPPDTLWDDALFNDHGHYNAEGAGKFTDWLGEEIARMRPAR
ncbi:MAG: hypothetical protein K8T90_21155 [Planctomycetes bacterium]|nr:hypothetical protein [Planctomycetota bacterium]